MLVPESFWTTGHRGAGVLGKAQRSIRYSVYSQLHNTLICYFCEPVLKVAVVYLRQSAPVGGHLFIPVYTRLIRKKENVFLRSIIKYVVATPIQKPTVWTGCGRRNARCQVCLKSAAASLFVGTDFRSFKAPDIVLHSARCIAHKWPEREVALAVER